MRLSAAPLIALVGLAACAPRVRPDYPEPEDTDDPMALMPDAGPRTSPASGRDAVETRLAAGRVTRAELDGVLADGIGSFLGGVQVEPAFVGEKFYGWEIVAFWPDDRRFARVNLLPGDVVRSVNGMPIERPEQLQDLWDGLRTATSIAVQVFRGGAPHDLLYIVVP